MKRAALYARVSTHDQHPDAQLVQLRDYASHANLEALEYVDEGVSGSQDRRPALGALLDAVHRREVDIVVCTKLDRLARSVKHLCDLAADLETRAVAFVVLDQHIDTSTSSGRFLFHTLAAVAELERDLIRERTVSGLAAARRRGKRLGRPPRLDSEGVARVRRLREAGHSLRAIGRLLDVSEGTIRRALRAA